MLIKSSIKNKKNENIESLAPHDYEAFFRALGEHVIVSATDSRGNIIYANDKFAEISKYARAELLGQNHRILKSGYHAPKFYADIWKTISSGQVWRGEIKNRAQDGTFYWVDTSIVPILGKDGKPDKYVSVRFLITRRKKVEKELKRRKEHSEFLADVSVILASVLNYEAMLKYLTKRIVSTIADWCLVDLAGDGREAGKILSRVASAHANSAKASLAEELRKLHLHGADALLIMRVFKDGQSEFCKKVTEDYFEKSGYSEKRRWLLKALGTKSLLRVPIVNGQKAVMGIITLAVGDSGREYDESDLELAKELGRRAGIAIENARLYRQLQEVDKRKDEFIATLSHELRNPLAPILLRCQLLQSRVDFSYGGDSELKETAATINRQVKTMARLLDDLLDISRLMRGKIILNQDQIDASLAISRAIETAEPLLNERRIKLIISRQPERLLIHVDPIRIEQALVNLLNNAAKFSNAGGRVWVESSRGNNCVLIRVRDEGLGIDPKLIDDIFKNFSQVHQPEERRGGLGIGLALSKKLVELHGGDITVKSAGRGRGSEFTISLPLSEFSGKNFRPAKILVVDDNIDVAEALAACFREAGYIDIQIAGDGETAIKIGRDFKPNYVFMDIRMPGLDGYQAIKRMQPDAAFKDAIFIAITGYGQEQDKRKTKEAGFRYHFTKPIDFSKALLLIKSDNSVYGSG